MFALSFVPLWLTGWSACSSTTTYLRGPAPIAALPDPEVRVTVRERTEDGVWSAGRTVFECTGPRALVADALAVTGRVDRITRGPAPRQGFRIIMGTADRETVFETALYREMPDLDLKKGDVVSFRAQPTQEGYLVEVLDERGAVFRLVAGGPSTQFEDVRTRMTHHEAYWEVRADEDLCVRSDVHRFVRVEVGREAPRIDPGGSQVLCDEDGECGLVVVVDARETKERRCRRSEPPRQIVLWMRVPPGER